MIWTANFEDTENSPSKRELKDLVCKVVAGKNKKEGNECGSEIKLKDKKFQNASELYWILWYGTKIIPRDCNPLISNSTPLMPENYLKY